MITILIILAALITLVALVISVCTLINVIKTSKDIDNHIKNAEDNLSKLIQLHEEEKHYDHR